MAQPVLAQSAAIGGVVRDPQQAVVPAAQVVLIAHRSAARTAATTDGQGRYSFSNLTPDTYVVEAQAKGFQVTTSQPIALAGSQTATQDFVLTLAAAAESVTVTATGEVDHGYRVAAVGSLGPLGPATLLDT